MNRRGGTVDSNRQLPPEAQAGQHQVKITNVGLSFPERPITFDYWQQAGARVARMANASAWYLGDWLAYGESQYANRYRSAVEAVGVSYQTLRNYAWVARRFPLSRRRDTLTFFHHMEVAKLSPREQDRWLDLAAERSWSVRKLRQQLRSGELTADRSEVKSATPLRIETETQRVDRWRAAAARASVPLTHWVVSCLDAAAGDELDRA